MLGSRASYRKQAGLQERNCKVEDGVQRSLEGGSSGLSEGGEVVRGRRSPERATDNRAGYRKLRKTKRYRVGVGVRSEARGRVARNCQGPRSIARASESRASYRQQAGL